MPLLRAAAEGRHELGGARIDQAQVEFAVRAGLGPLLNHVTRDDPAALSHLSRALLAGADMAGEALYRGQTTALAEILEAGGEIADDVTLLKGISVCRHYPCPHLRTMNDIDLLVSPAGLPRLEALLREMGYRRDKYGMEPGFYREHHHSRPFVHPQTNVRLEAHRALFPADRRLPDHSALSVSAASTQTVSGRLEGMVVRRFGPELELVYLAAHWAYDCHLPLVYAGLLDAIYLLRNDGERIDWDLIGAWCECREVATPLCVLLGYLMRHGLVDRGEVIVAMLDEAPKSVGRFGTRALHRIVGRCLEGGFRDDSASKEVLEIVWQALVAPGAAWTKAFAVPFGVVFPPRHPDRFSPALQLHRVRSLLRRCLGGQAGGRGAR